MDAADLPLDRPKLIELRRAEPSQLVWADTRLQISQNSASASSKTQLHELMKKINENASTGSSGPLLENEGQISSMQLPSAWIRSTVEQHSIPTANYVEFHNSKNPQQKLATYYRGQRISTIAAKNFHQLLKAKEHNLDEAEYRLLDEVLRDKSRPEDFEITNKKTIDINSKRVLVVEGRFNQINQVAMSIYVDAEDTGEVVQEVFYQAPQADYDSGRQSAEKSIKSIVWK